MTRKLSHYILVLVGIMLVIYLNACIETPVEIAEPEPTLRTAPDLQWSQTFGSSWSNLGRSVQQTSDGGYIICGITESYGDVSGDVWLIKTDADGSKIWDKVFGGDGIDAGVLAQQTTDGGYIVCGNTMSVGAGDENIWLIKTDAEGNKLWDKTFGGTESAFALAAQQTIDGGYVACGTKSTTAGDLDVWLIKTDADGKMIWDKTFGGFTGRSVQQTTDGGYIVCSRGGWLIRTDADGNRLWDREFSYALPESVQQAKDGGYIICGSNLGDAWLLKTDAKGNKLWSRIFFDNSTGYSAKQTSNGGYIMCGVTYSDETSSGKTAWLIRTDARGNKLWDKTFDDGSGFSVQQTSDGGYVICGEAYSFGARDNILLLKVAPEQ